MAKEDYGKVVLAIYSAAKDVYLPFITNNTERLSFKSGYVILMENGKMRRQL